MFKSKKPIFTLVLGLLLLTIVGFLLPGASIQPVAADTYDVTSTSCTGPGSITAAMDMANANPGTDTISIAPGLQIDARLCPPDAVTPNPDDYYFLQATESVIIEGSGAKLKGANLWIGQSGDLAQFTQCYDENLRVATSPGFIRVGVPKADNSAITVTVRDLEFDNLSGMALVEKNASFVLEDAHVRRLVPSTKSCNQNLIKAYEGANVTLRGNSWVGNAVHGIVVFYTVHNGLIGGDKAGDLTIEDSRFSANGTTGLGSWFGQAGSEVKIVSSQFSDTGGIDIAGAATSYIVNSMWVGDTLDVTEDERLANASSGDMNIIASTFLFPNVACDRQCQVRPGESSKGWLVREGKGNINFVQSAVEVAYPDFKGNPDYTFVRLLDDFGKRANGFSADGATWIRPTPLQDADALKAITSQPGLLTAQPAFRLPILVTDGVWATPLVPGELIDRIENAACGQANELLNPVDNTCITVDALGNPRVDGNDKRNIGAVQVTKAPHLSVFGTGDETVDLIWTKPRDLPGTITGYALHYRVKGTTNWTIALVNGGDTLMRQVTGLTNGTEYEFMVDSILDPTTPAFNFSNIVTATPYGQIDPPVVTAVSGNGEVQLFWTEPNAGGHPGPLSYGVVYRPVGAVSWLVGPQFLSARTTVIPGLKNGTEYEFGVFAFATDGATGPRGTTTATPLKPVEPPQPGEENCTLSSGYWSTHSEYGPSLYDETWAMLTNGADTPFFLSGQSYYEMINADPEGNAYYILAQQHIAAELNFLRGADPAAVQSEFDQAKALFEQYTPAEVEALASSDPVRQQFVYLASILDDYNNGYIGPGYCTD